MIFQKPLIDPTSEKGDKPNKFGGAVELRNVGFTYPTRPDVKVRLDHSGIDHANIMVYKDAWGDCELTEKTLSLKYLGQKDRVADFHA